MDFSIINIELVAKLLLLLLIGMGPKIALVPFLEKTKNFDAETQRAVGRRIILAILATNMASGPGKKSVEEAGVKEDPRHVAVYPLAIPYLFDPVGITILIIASAEVVSAASIGLVLGLVLLVGAFDYLVFANIDKLAKRLNPTGLIISEVVFGILLTAVAVQLTVSGLSSLGIIAALAPPTRNASIYDG